MSTDKDALRERAREWFGEYGQLVCYGHRPEHETDYDPSRCAGCVDSLTALLTTSAADAVAQERREIVDAIDGLYNQRLRMPDDRRITVSNVVAMIRARTTTPTPESAASDDYDAKEIGEKP